MSRTEEEIGTILSAIGEPETWDAIWDRETPYYEGRGMDMDLWMAIDVELARLPGPLVVADVAGGRGEFLWWLRTRARTSVVWSVLIDFSRRAIEDGELAMRADEYVCSDAASIEFESATCDVVLGIDFLQSVDDPVACVREMARLTIPTTGRLVLVGAEAKHWMHLRPVGLRQVRELAELVGSVLVEVETGDRAGHSLVVVRVEEATT